MRVGVGVACRRALGDREWVLEEVAETVERVRLAVGVGEAGVGVRVWVAVRVGLRDGVALRLGDLLGVRDAVMDEAVREAEREAEGRLADGLADWGALPVGLLVADGEAVSGGEQVEVSVRDERMDWDVVQVREALGEAVDGVAVAVPLVVGLWGLGLAVRVQDREGDGEMVSDAVRTHDREPDSVRAGVRVQDCVGLGVQLDDALGA